VRTLFSPNIPDLSHWRGDLFGGVTRTFHNPDKELVGQGLGNMLAGPAGGLPGAGATIRTLSNINTGGRTALSGVVHAAVLLGVALGLGRAVAFIPHTALAGILMKVGIDIIDWRFLARMHRTPRMDLVLMCVVLLLTVLVDIITAGAAGVVLASLAFVKEATDHQIESIRPVHDPEHAGFFGPEETALFRRCDGRLLVLHRSGLISFGAASALTRKHATVGHYDILLIDLFDVPKMDGSAALALENIIQRADTAGQDVIIAGLNTSLARTLGTMGVLDRIRETARFANRRDALQAAVDLVSASARPAGTA